MEPSGRDIDKGWAWVVMIASMFWNFLIAGTLKSFGLFYVSFQVIFESTPTETSLMAFMFSLMMCLVCPVAGYLGDLLPVRVVAMTAALLATLGMVLTAFAPTITWAIITYGFITGLAASTMDSLVFGILNKSFIKRHVLANSIAFVGSGLGAFALPPFLSFIIDYYAVRGSMFIMGGLWMHSCIIAVILKPVQIPSDDLQIDVIDTSTTQVLSTQGTVVDITDFQQDDQKLSKENKTSNNEFPDSLKDKDEPCIVQNGLANRFSVDKEFTDNKISRSSSLSKFQHDDNNNNTMIVHVKNYCTFLQNFGMLMVLAALFCGSFAYFNQLFLLPPYCQELGYTTEDSAYLLSIIGASEIVSRLALGFIADKPFINHIALVTSCSALTLISGITVTFFSSIQFTYLMVYAAFLGVIGGTFIPLAFPLIIKHVKRDRISSCTGLFLGAMGFSFCIGPPLLSEIKEATGLYAYSYQACLLMYIPACLMFLLSMCKMNRKTEKRYQVVIQDKN